MKLKDDIVKEGKGHSRDGSRDGILTVDDLFHRIEGVFWSTILDKDESIRKHLTYNMTFLIAYFLKKRHRSVYDYYLDQIKGMLRSFEKIKEDHISEEIEYLGLKSRLDCDLLLACVFHDYIRGRERYLRIPRRIGKPKEDKMKECLENVKPWLKLLKEFKIKKYLYKAMLLLNALAGKEIYSTELDRLTRSGLKYDRDRRTGLKTKGEKLLAKEFRRIKLPA